MGVINLHTLAGLALWIGALFLVPSGDTQGEISRILLLGLLVVMPLGIDLGRAPGKESNLYSTARYLQPFAALVAATSFLIPAGVLAGTLAIAWLPLTGMLALDALLRVRKRGIGPLEETAVDVGAIYLPIGAYFLWASRMGLAPFGHSEPIILLTAVHFHFAGCAGPLLAGLAGRFLRGRDGVLSAGFGIAAVLILAGPALFAAGFPSSPSVELIGAALLAAGYVWLSAILAFNIRGSLESRLAKLLITVSALAAVLTLGAAVLFALGNASLLFYLPVSQMLSMHGWLNALGFVLPGLLGWAVENAQRSGENH